MTIAYLLGGQIPLTPEYVTEFYNRYPAVRNAYEKAAEWTGFSPSDLVGGDLDVEGQLVQSFGALRQAALIFGIHDVLAERNIYPDAVGGLSLGGLIGASLAGAVDRRELFEMLHHQRLLPDSPPDSPAQGMAVAALSIEDDSSFYYGHARPGVYLAADYDVVPGGNKRVIVLAGYLEELNKLAEEKPRQVKLLEDYVGAFHSPLVQYAADFMEPQISGMTFEDPRIVMCSAQTAGSITTADAVRELFLLNYVSPISIKPLMEEVERIGSHTVLGLGPGMPQSPQGNAAEALKITTVLTPAELDEVAL